MLNSLPQPLNPAEKSETASSIINPINTKSIIYVYFGIYLSVCVYVCIKRGILTLDQ